MQTKIEKQPKSTIKMTVVIENSAVKDFYEKEVSHAVEHVEIQGFRKGTAPKEMVIEKVGNSRLYGDTINSLLQHYYPQALKENHLNPISNPKVDIKEFDISKDLEFTAEFAVRPEVKIGDYKKALKDYYKEKTEKLEAAKLEKSKEEGDDKKEEQEHDHHHDHVHIGSNEVIDILIKETKTEVSDILLEEETDRMMTRLVEQLETIKLPLDKYLEAQGKTAEELRKEYNDMSEKNIKAELVMAHLIEVEKIETTDEEIDEMISAIGDPTLGEKLEDPVQRLYIKNILQKNKLLTKLIEEVEGPNFHGNHEHKEKKDE